MVDYPVSLPVDALKILGQKVVSPNSVNNAEAAKAGWNVLGYGLSRGLPVADVQDTTNPIGAMDQGAAIATLLENGDTEGGKVATFGPLTWLTVVKLVWDILKAVS